MHVVPVEGHVPGRGWAGPPSSLIGVDRLAPEGPMTAVRVPGRAVNDTLVSGWWPSMAKAELMGLDTAGPLGRRRPRRHRQFRR